MADNTFLARDYTFEVKDAGGTYVEIKGIDTWSPSASANDADTTTFDDEGNLSHVKASRGLQITLSGKEIDGDDGQDECATWATLKGADSLRDFRITDPTGDTKVFKASCTLNEGGGGNDAPSAWSVTIIRSGATADSSLGSALSAPTSVSGTSATGGTLVSFTQSGTATLYEVQLLSGSSVAVTVRSNTKPVWVPASAGSYTAKARSYNANGWSALSSASSSITVS